VECIVGVGVDEGKMKYGGEQRGSERDVIV
jgi:hypothetical protein